MDKDKNIDKFIEMEEKFSSGLYSLKPFRIVGGKGVYLFTENEKYLDFMTGHGVACLGHCHPNVVKAIEEQANKIITLHSAYPNEVRAKFFKLMAEITPKNLTKSFITNSGTESVEAALKLALSYKRGISKPNIIAMKRGFHGRTFGSLSITFNQQYKKPFSSFLYPDIKFASFNDIESVKKLIDGNTIAIITELVQGEGGVYPATKEFAQQLREICTEKDILLIVDEVQTGFGRCGEMFAGQHYKIEPDIMSVAKGIAGGVPMGAVISTEDIFSKIRKGEHASTFGGNPLAAAASVATIQTLINDKIPENAKKMGNFVRTQLQSQLELLPGNLMEENIREIRGLGLLIGIQFKKKIAPYLKYCEEVEKVIFLPAGMTVLRMLPPLIINEEHAKIAINSIGNALKNIK